MQSAREIQILAFPEEDLPLHLQTRIRSLRKQAWPNARRWPMHDPALDPLSLVLLVDGCVTAALDILSKPLEHAGANFAARGLSTVVTDAAKRGRGYGRHLVEAARSVMGESGADLGIFTCDRPLLGFYERAGWSLLPGTVLVGGTPEAPFPSDQWDKVTLAEFFSPRAQALAGTFVGARVALHSGEIDKLW